MRFPHRPAALIAALGVILATLALSLSFAAASNPSAASAPAFHQVVPGIAGDSASGFGQPSTASTATSTATPPSGACASGHASLRAFTDPGAASVPRDPQPATLSFFNLMARPSAIPSDATRTAPLETTFYTVTANLVSLSMCANGAWDIVLDNGGGVSMRASFPAQGCLSSLSPEDQGAINGARTTLRTICGEPPASGSRALRGTATITGPGYWGTKAIENASASGAEIGPVFAFQYTDSGSCDPSHFVPTPTPTVPPLQALAIGVDRDQGTGYHRGDTVTATALLMPRIPGVACAIQFAVPVGSGFRVVTDDPGLVTKTSGPDGIVQWQFKIPMDSDAGVSPGGGRLQVLCEQGAIQRQATDAITIRVP